MEKITIKELVDFRRKSDKSKKTTFVKNLRTRKPKPKKDKEDKNGGGNHWVTSTSCLIKVYKENDPKQYDLKIEDLNQRHKVASEKHKITLSRNIEILINFKDFEFSDIRPLMKTKFITIHRESNIIDIQNFPIYINPSIVFTFEESDEKKLGAIWFIPKIKGFNKPELGMFCEALYRFLKKTFGNEYEISEKFCVSIDTFNAQKISYSEITQGNIPLLIDSTLKEMNEL